jgi:predicted NUDIX family NTP pyrophosphohydrolase
VGQGALHVGDAPVRGQLPFELGTRLGPGVLDVQRFDSAHRSFLPASLVLLAFMMASAPRMADRPPVGASRYRWTPATRGRLGVEMPKLSAGLLLYRVREGAVEVLLVHPGGPFWAKKDLGAWTIPKGEYEQGQDPLAAALREFEEETGQQPPRERLLELGSIRQRSGKILTAWAAAGDLDPAAVTSNTFSMEWPPRSGVQREFPEVDRAGWFDPDLARDKLLAAQAELVDRLLAAIDHQPDADHG